MPVVCFRLVGQPPFSVFDLSDLLRQRGWIVPAYTMAPDAGDIAVLRIVVREGLSADMAAELVTDIAASLAHLRSLGIAAGAGSSGADRVGAASSGADRVGAAGESAHASIADRPAPGAPALEGKPAGAPAGRGGRRSRGAPTTANRAKRTRAIC